MSRAAVLAPPAASPRWTAWYEPGVARELPASDALLPDLYASAAASAPTFPALECFGRRLSYAALHALGDRVASALLRDGLALGARVAIDLPDGAERVAATLGALRAGCVAVSGGSPSGSSHGAVSAALAIVERGAEGRAAAPRVVAVDPTAGLPPLVRLLSRLGRRRRATSRGATPIAWRAWLRGPTGDVPRPSPDAAALDEGGATFTHGHLVAASAQLRAWLTDAVPGGESWLVLVPPGSALWSTAVLGCAAALRARVVLLPAWQPEDVVDALREHQPAWVVADADGLRRLAADPAVAWADVRSVRAWLVAGPVGAGVVRGFEEATGAQPCVGLAHPRAAGLLSCQPVNGRRVGGTLGVPLPGTTAVDLGDGTVALSAPTVAGDAPIHVAGRLDADGYLHVGDPDARGAA